MQSSLNKVLVIFFFTFVLFSCTEEDAPTAPPSVGVWKGTTDKNNAVSFTISNNGGKASLTSFSFEYSYMIGSSNYTESISQSDTEGILEVKNDSFRIDLSDATDNYIMAEIDGNDMSGSYSISTATSIDGNTIFAVGTFTAKKQ